MDRIGNPDFRGTICEAASWEVAADDEAVRKIHDLLGEESE
jgi:hypothetical protein